MKTATLFCAFLITTTFFPLMAQEVNPSIVQAAREGLNTYLQKIPEDMMQKYGFDSAKDMELATLGSPLNLSMVRNQANNKLKEAKNISPLTETTNLWYFPIKVKGKIAAFLIVDKVNENWKAVSLGYASLADEIDLISNNWKADKGYTINLSVNYQAKEFYFSIPQAGFKNLTPIDLKKNRLFQKSDKYKTLVKEEITLNSLDSKLKKLKTHN